jgi:D-beta-D-heptose 7-phosphate kinase/D-beta-D-heptose 1-phosphate adenosyltransferase
MFNPTDPAGFTARHVLVLGDVMLNRYVLGEVWRISPEAPIPALRGIGDIAPSLVRDLRRPTTVKTRFMSGSHQLLRLDKEESGALLPLGEEAVPAAFAQSLFGRDVVVLSDYAKGVLIDRVLAEAIAQARRASVPMVADPKRPTFAAYRHVSVLTPNFSEPRGRPTSTAATTLGSSWPGRPPVSRRTRRR